MVLKMDKSSTIIYFTGFIVGCLVLSACVPTVLAGEVINIKMDVENNDNPCKLCLSKDIKDESDSGCKSCNEAVAFAIDYMKDYVKDKINNTYFLWSMDATIIIVQGLVDGFKESGYKIEIDVNELKDNIQYWVNKTVGPQKFSVTLFLAKLGAITIGVTGYLLTLCIDDDSRSSQSKNRSIGNISWIKSRTTLWVILKHLLGLFH